MEEQKYLANIITNEELDSIQPGLFNVLKAPRGWGKTTFMFDERILKMARERKHVLYLIHNTATRNMIANQHQDKAKVFSDGNYNGWFLHRKKGIWTTEEDENFVHVMCYQTFAALLRNEGVEWLDDIDLIVWDEFDDIGSYYKKDVKDIKKMLPKFSYNMLVNLLQEGNPNSVVNFIYQIKTIILDPARIKLLAISATPEVAVLYFRDYINYILKGKLEEKYYAYQTNFIENIVEAFKDGTIAPGKKYWIFTPFISDELRIEVWARKYKMNPLTLWSENNPKYRDQFTEEKREALHQILNTGIVPDKYDVVIVNSVVGRGINLYDTSFQDWICISSNFEDTGQFMRARFNPERQYFTEEVRGMIDFITNGFPADYYEWHSLAELKELLNIKPFYTKVEKEGDEPKRLTTFSAVKKEYPDLFESRRYGKARTTQYRIKPAS